MESRMREVARIARVSSMTVSRVLKDSPLVRPATKERVRKVIEELDYKPNASAARLRTKKLNTIGIVGKHFMAYHQFGLHYLHAELIRGASAGIRESGLPYDILLGRPEPEALERPEYLRLVKENKVDGVIIIYPDPADPDLATIRAKGIPAVLIGCRYRGLDAVNVDNHRGITDIVDHVAGQGRTRVAFLNGNSGGTDYAERLAAFREGMARHGLTCDDGLVVQDLDHDGPAYEATKGLVARQPDTIVAATDLLAAGAARALAGAGLSIPDDVALTGFDDTPQAAALRPALTTIHQPLVAMGSAAARLLLDRIAQPDNPAQNVNLPGQLVVRESTVKP